MKLVDHISHHLAKPYSGQQRREGELLLLAAAAALDKGRWIPVSERMPEGGVDVLAYCDGSFYVGYTDGGQWQDEENFRDCEYWMPLPEPPQQP